MTDKTQRINDIELAITHQGRFAEELSTVVYEQSQQISALLSAMKRLENQIKTLESHVSGGPSASTAEEASPWKDPEM